MKYRIAMFLALILTAGLLAGCPSRNVVATVNGESIYASELDARVAKIKEGHPKVFQGKTGAQTEQVIRKKTLDTMIDNLVLVQAAAKEGVTADDKEINERIDQMKKLFQGQKQFDEALKKQGWTVDDLKNNLKTMVIQQKMMEKLAKSSKVSAKAVADFYKKNKKNFQIGAQVEVSEILVKTKAEADKIKAQLEAGDDFAGLAKKNSIDLASKGKGGEMGWRLKTDLEPTVSNVAFSLTVGGVSSPVKTSLGYAIVKVTGKKPSRTRPLSEVRKSIEKQLKSNLQRDAYQKWLAEQKKKADIKRYL